MQIKINEQFRDLIPPLTSEELSQLEQNIRAEGCRDPLVVWNGIILDGHNRFEICKEYGIQFNVYTLDFDNEEQAKLWMINNQQGRRNLTDGWKYELAQMKKAILAEKGKEKQSPGINQHTDRSLSNTDNEQKHDTRKEIAADLGWSTGKTAQADYVWNNGDDELKEKVKKGEITINKAYQETKNVHVSNNSGENEWYTPSEYIESARRVMGSIDTDPASSELANKTVKANCFYTKDDDGLVNKWVGNVWINPPYAQPLIKQFCEALAEKYQSGETSQAILLVNNATETAWLQPLMSIAKAVCFPKGRIKFIDKNGLPNGAPLQGQAILYFGNDKHAFTEEFQKYGVVLYGAA